MISLEFIFILGLFASIAATCGFSYALTKEKYGVEKNKSTLRAFNVVIFLFILTITLFSLILIQKQINQEKNEVMDEVVNVIKIQAITKDGDTINIY